MDSNNQIDKNINYNYRITHYYALIMLLAAMIFSILIVVFMAIITKVFFYGIVVVLFVFAFISNYYIYRKRARFYIFSFNAAPEQIEIKYYDQNQEKTLLTNWNDFDYYFGVVKGDNYLVVCKNGEEILKCYKSFGKHKNTFLALSEAFQKFIAPERIKNLTPLNFFNAFKCTYTKNYGFQFKLY